MDNIPTAYPCENKNNNDEAPTGTVINVESTEPTATVVPTIINEPVTEATVVNIPNERTNIPSPVTSYRSGEVFISQSLEGTDNMIMTWNLSRSISCFAGIDIFFYMLNMFYNPWACVAVLFPLYGYIGAKRYNNTMLYVYSIFIGLIIVGRIVFLYYLLKNNSNASILNIISIIIEIWIMKILCKLINYIKGLTESELYQLREPTYTPIRTQFIWY